MYGDTDVVRRQVRALREQGGEIRLLADRLVAQVERVGWTGRAADALDARARERAARLREAAGRHDGAADALERHLQAVEAAQEQIASVERRTTRLVEDARARVAAARRASETSPGDVRVVADATDEELAGFVAPPSGHRDWLGVELPGL